MLFEAAYHYSSIILAGIATIYSLGQDSKEAYEPAQGLQRIKPAKLRKTILSTKTGVK
jgi:hypothetical protein